MDYTPYYEIMRSTSLLRGLSDAELDTLMTCFAPRVRRYAKGELLLMAGYETKDVGIILEGEITATKPMPDGTPITMARMGPGGVFADVLAGGRSKSPVNVTAVEDYRACRERYDDLAGQRDDLVKAQDDLLGIIDRLDDYTKMIRDAGMIPGLSAHMPELVVYSDANGYDVETYIQIFNCMGFLMQVEIETVASIIQNAKKPVMTIKSMAAGRCSPYVGLTFSWNAIREKDMVTVGAFSAHEAEEDIEISLAAIEHRFPDLEKRSSPNQNQAAFG